MRSIQRISIIGAGCVANFFAREMHRKGFEIVEIISRTEERAKIIADASNAKLNINDFEHIDPSADLYIVSVKDDAIMDLRKKIKLRDQLIVHTSGSVTSEVFKKTSSHYGILYPLQSFSKNYRIPIEEVPLFVHANQSETAGQLLDLARKLSPQVMLLDDEKRTVLHMAAVFASNFPNYLFKISKEIMDDEGIDFQLLKPLVAESLRKAFILGPEKAQTGPAKRGDCGITDKHKSLLKKTEWKKLYGLLSDMIREDFKSRNK